MKYCISGHDSFNGAVGACNTPTTAPKGGYLNCSNKGHTT